MGWFGYGNYDGDDTRTRHIDFCKWAGIFNDDTEDEWMGRCMVFSKTLLSTDEKKILSKNIDKILKKMPKKKYLSEDGHLEWQMLALLFMDNKMKIPKIIKQRGLDAGEYLLGEHSSDFREPGRRRAAIRRYMAKLK